MSRIGKKPVPVPAGVTANVDGQTVKVKGPKGALQLVAARRRRRSSMDKGAITVEPRNETKRARSMWGTSRTLVVEPGRPASPRASRASSRSPASATAPRCRARTCSSQLGYSHDVDLSDPGRHRDRDAEADRNRDLRHRQAERSARLPPRSAIIRPPEPYKGKGVKYAGEYIFRKEGKKK